MVLTLINLNKKITFSDVATSLLRTTKQRTQTVFDIVKTGKNHNADIVFRIEVNLGQLKIKLLAIRRDCNYYNYYYGSESSSHEINTARIINRSMRYRKIKKKLCNLL